MFSEEGSVSLLNYAKSLIVNPSYKSDVIHKLAEKKNSEQKFEVYYNNIYNFCRKFVKKDSKKDLIHRFNSMISFIKSGNILENCYEFVPKNTRVSSNIKGLHNYIGRDADMVLIKSIVLSADSAVLDKKDIKLVEFALRKNIPVYLISSVFNIDAYNMYSPFCCFSKNLFDGVISENGFEKFDDFINNAKKDFSWLFF